MTNGKESHCSLRLVCIYLLPAIAHHQNLFEGTAKEWLTANVDDGIEQAVSVSQPESGSIECYGDDTVGAEWFDDVEEEERQPAHHENCHDQA